MALKIATKPMPCKSPAGQPAAPSIRVPGPATKKS